MVSGQLSVVFVTLLELFLSEKSTLLKKNNGQRTTNHGQTLSVI